MPPGSAVFRAAGLELRDATGFGNLSKVWKSFEGPAADIVHSTIVLLYDCDIEVRSANNRRVARRGMPFQDDNPVKKGIENLFPVATVLKIEAAMPTFIDLTPSTVKRERGISIEVPETRSVNPNEKKNLCDWLCKNGTAEDFGRFASVFQTIRQAIAPLSRSTTDA